MSWGPRRFTLKQAGPSHGLKIHYNIGWTISCAKVPEDSPNVGWAAPRVEVSDQLSISIQHHPLLPHLHSVAGASAPTTMPSPP